MGDAKFTKGEWVKTGQFIVKVGGSGPCTESSMQGTGGVFRVFQKERPTPT